MQAKLGATGCAAFDIQAVCSGFVYALAIADKLIRSGQHRCALVDDAAGPLPDAALVEVKSGKRFKLDRAVNIIGRSATCDVHIPSEKVSRQSAGIVAEGGRFWVEDLGSPNGVFMGGVRIKKHQLANGDVIQVGDAGFRYEVTSDE